MASGLPPPEWLKIGFLADFKLVVFSAKKLRVLITSASHGGKKRLEAKRLTVATKQNEVLHGSESGSAAQALPVHRHSELTTAKC